MCLFFLAFAARIIAMTLQPIFCKYHAFLHVGAGDSMFWQISSISLAWDEV